MKNIVTTTWLEQHLYDEDIVILDASMDAVTETESIKTLPTYIPSSIFFDIKNTFSCPNSKLPNTVPSYQQFRDEVRKLGIKNNTKVIVYDDKGIYSAPRVWWLFKLMGHESVFVLDGGLPKWLSENRATSKVLSQPQELSSWEGNYLSHLTIDKLKLHEMNQTSQIQLIDTRGSSRFEGLEPEPRKGLRSGHIPHAINIPFQSLLSDGCYKSNIEIEEAFISQKIDIEQALYLYCGSGVTACIVAIAALEIGAKNICIYDGSWTEWGSDNSLPIE